MKNLIIGACALVLAAGCNFREPPTGPTTVQTSTTVTTTVNPTPTPTPTTPVPTPTPTPGGGLRVPDPPTGAALPLPAYGQSEVMAYASTSAGSAALVTACPGHATSWAFMDGLIDRLRAKDTRWGYFCKNGNCFDVSADVIGYHATAGPDTAGAAGTIGVDVIGDLCGSNTPQWVPYPFSPSALWTTRGRF
jgi:hypothetical protein